MNQHGEGWNEKLLKELFSKAEVQAIMRILVSSMGFKDRLIWNSTSNGQYIVNTGYKVAKNNKQKAKGDKGTSKRREVDEVKMWKNVWKLDIKKKIQHFI